MEKRGIPHQLQWVGLFIPVAILGLAFVAYLTPTDALVWPSGILGTTYRGDTPIGTVPLQFREGRWAGEVHDFPVGTSTHFAPDTYHGFFVVHTADGQLLALSTHRGQRVYWHDPLPTYDRRGRDPGFRDRDYGTEYAADGLNTGGPAPRPLDPYPLTIVGDRLLIGLMVDCPPDLPMRQPWCRDAQP